MGFRDRQYRVVILRPSGQDGRRIPAAICAEALPTRTPPRGALRPREIPRSARDDTAHPAQACGSRRTGGTRPSVSSRRSGDAPLRHSVICVAAWMGARGTLAFHGRRRDDGRRARTVRNLARHRGRQFFLLRLLHFASACVFISHAEYFATFSPRHPVPGNFSARIIPARRPCLCRGVAPLRPLRRQRAFARCDIARRRIRRADRRVAQPSMFAGRSSATPLRRQRQRRGQHSRRRCVASSRRSVANAHASAGAQFRVLS